MRDRFAAAFDREAWARRKNAVLERVSLYDAVTAKVALKHAGGAEYKGLCPFHNEKTPSFTVNTRKGFFHCFGCGHHGSNAIDFVIALNFPGMSDAFQQAVELLERENGLHHFKASAPPPPRPKVEQREDLDKAAAVRRLWEEAKPLTAGDPVDRYLRGRCLRPPGEWLTGSRDNAGWPETLRFAARCWHGIEKRHLPAMIAAMRRPDGKLTAVHRTYLAVSGTAVTKAGTERDKAMFGSPLGTWMLLGPVDDHMVGGEGIETTLAAMQLFGRSGLAFGSRAGMAKTELPFACSDFIYAADRNKPHLVAERSRVGERAAFAGAKAHGVGRTVRVKVPALPGDGLGDFNDMLKLRVAASERRSGQGMAA